MKVGSVWHTPTPMLTAVQFQGVYLVAIDLVCENLATESRCAISFDHAVQHAARAVGIELPPDVEALLSLELARAFSGGVFPQTREA